MIQLTQPEIRMLSYLVSDASKARYRRPLLADLVKITGLHRDTIRTTIYSLKKKGVIDPVTNLPVKKPISEA